MKKNTLDKFMVTRLEIQNKNNKIVKLPDGTDVVIPRLSYKHFVKIKSLADPMDTLRYLINEIKPRELSAAETEFILIHLHYHNDKAGQEVLSAMKMDIDQLQITPAKYEYTFDNIQLYFNQPSMMNDYIPFLLNKAIVDGKEIELTEETRTQLINSLYRYEYEQVKSGVLQEVFIIHEGKTIKGLNIIGE
ncbi:baseplate hub distal subunit [Pantoea phage Phynn]|nr:baseplate hub distal subunit [Pantoea phage Phynn]